MCCSLLVKGIERQLSGTEIQVLTACYGSKALVLTDLKQLPLKSASPAPKQRRPLMSASDFCLLGDFKGAINLDAQVSNGRLKLRVTEQQLHGTQVLGAPIDQRRLGPSH